MVRARGRRPAALAIVLAALAASCARQEDPSTNLVVIGIDTLRADHVGCYGYRRPTSPHIDALARDGVLFTTAVSQAPWTLPAFASIMTGLLPSHHRAGEGKLPYVSALGPDAETLAATLARQGFVTAGFVSNVWVGADTGLDRGFATHRMSQQPAEAVDRAIAWLGSRPAGRFFLFVHIYDPHAPYTPPDEDVAPFVTAGYEGPFQRQFPTVWKGGVPDMAVDPRWSPADRQRIVDLYDGEIHYADRLVGRLLEALDRLHLADETLVVVVADHGEELFDHRRLGHSHTLYDELLRVPLVLRFPHASLRGRVTRQVRSMDLFPTLLEALRVPVPSGLDGVSLLPLARGEPDAVSPAAFAESVVQGEDVGAQAIRLQGEKLILFPSQDRSTYYDLSVDPHEQLDLAATKADRVGDLAATLAQALPPLVDGYYLTAIGRHDHDLHLRATCADGFTDVTSLHTEDDDRVTLADDGRTLEIDFHLRPRPSATVRHDLDGVRFRTGGAAPITFAEGTLDGTPLPPAPPPTELLTGTDPTLPGTADVVRYPVLPARLNDADFGVSFQLVRPNTPAAAQLAPGDVERLRALGYAE
jgi:arylsulfatase A-like enzyme